MMNSLRDGDDNGPDYLSESDGEDVASAQASARLHNTNRHANVVAFRNYLTDHNENAEDDPLPTRYDDCESESNSIINKARDYQQELFDRAKEENIIAVLDTGSGKTLIAALLIRHVLQQELLNRAANMRPRMVFFLVNSVHLARQQANFLKNNLPTPPIALFGHANDDLWKRADWERISASNDVVVCTAAVLDQCLMHSYLTIDQISLIVFDEAHHCKKNHPYSRIIRDYYIKSKGPRPRIFGMTASPVDSQRDVAQVSRDLEDLLQSKIVTTSDASIYSFAPKARDELWTYQPLGQQYETELYRQLYPLCHFVESLNRIFVFSKQASSHLGAWFSDRVWKHALYNSEHQAANIRKKVERSSLYTSMEQDSAAKESLLRKLDEAVQIAKRSHFTIPQIQDQEGRMEVTDPSSSTEIAPWWKANISTKVHMLYEKLRERYTRHPLTRALVFVDQRLTAFLLCELFESLRVPNIRPSVLVGVGQAADEGNSWKDQEEIMKRFRIGHLNLIFATSVAEEGIDIPQCNLVVRFDLFHTPIQYMQSRGRARMKDSVYAHMLEEGNERHESVVRYATQMDQYIRSWCQSLPPDRILGQGTKLNQLLAQDSASKRFVTVTGATANFSNCLLILGRYVASLRSGLAATSAEVYEEILDEQGSLFRYRVILPKVANVHAMKVRGGRGDARTNKVLARRAAAFDCVCKLRAEGLLDDNLDSIFKKLKPENANAKISVNDKTDSYEKKLKPDFWLNSGACSDVLPKQLYATHIHIVPERPLRRGLGDMVLLTREPLPEIPIFPLFLEDNILARVNFRAFLKPMPVTLAALEALTAYTLNGVMADCFNKSYKLESNCMSYWIAPLATSDLTADSLAETINLSEVHGASSNRPRWKEGDSSSWANAFLVDPGNGKFHYITGNIVPNVSIFDPPPESAKDVKKRFKDTIIEFTDSTWRNRGKELQSFKDRYDGGQPVFQAEIVDTRRDFLDRNIEFQNPVQCYIAPQPLQIGRVSPRMATTLQLLPAILHRLEAYLIVSEAFAKLDLSSVPTDLALQAYTKYGGSGGEDEDDYDENERHLTHQDAGSASSFAQPINYERLEFIGDSLLKLSTTITIYLRTTCNEEGMHCKRMELLSNSRLFSTACAPQNQLYQYIRSGTGENLRDTWYPEFLEQTSGRVVALTDKHRHQALGKKTIADVCEATIGACILATSHLPTPEKFDLGIKAITKLVADPDHDITSWDEIPPMYKPDAWSLRTNDPIAADLVSKIGSITGYYFRHPALLRSAFTHSSDVNSPVPDLQRLEFLGDACLDWVCIWWLFDQNPMRGPQWLTEHKMAMVSNKFLASLAVTLGFHLHINVNSPSLWGNISSYAAKVSAVYNGGDCEMDFWTDERLNIQPPKACADLVEAYIGAVLVDSGFDFREVETFFEKHVKKFFLEIERYDRFANRHPTTFMHRLVQETFRCRQANVVTLEKFSDPVTDIWKDNAAGDGDIGDEGALQGTTYHVGWVVHGRVVASAKGDSTRYAKVRASKAALKVLEDLKVDEFRETWGCDCGQAKEESARDEDGNG